MTETETRPVPFIANMLAFTQALHRVGLRISLKQSHEFLDSLELVDIGSREQVYHAARGTLVTQHEDYPLFDQVFALFWRSPAKPAPTATRPHPSVLRQRAEPRMTIATMMAARRKEEDPALEISDRSHTFSAAERLFSKDFSQMSPEELEAIKKLIQQMQWKVSLRVTRRFTPDRGGSSLDMRRMMRDSIRTGGVPLQQAFRARKIKMRPMVVLADISGSMEKYARLLLQFSHSVRQQLAEVECFVFGTRLTRITPQMKLNQIDLAIDEAARQVVDWSGGTRIGDSLKQFNRVWSRRVLRRGAVVLIISDGWELGDVTVLRDEMRYLQHRCHRLIWLNPLKGNERYQPLVEGMAAALPFVNDFLPIHNLQSLAQLAQHLATLDDRSQPRPRVLSI